MIDNQGSSNLTRNFTQELNHKERSTLTDEVYKHCVFHHDKHGRLVWQCVDSADSAVIAFLHELDRIRDETARGIGRVIAALPESPHDAECPLVPAQLSNDPS